MYLFRSRMVAVIGRFLTHIVKSCHRNLITRCYRLLCDICSRSWTLKTGSDKLLSPTTRNDWIWTHTSFILSDKPLLRQVSPQCWCRHLNFVDCGLLLLDFQISSSVTAPALWKLVLSAYFPLLRECVFIYLTRHRIKANILPVKPYSIMAKAVYSCTLRCINCVVRSRVVGWCGSRDF